MDDIAKVADPITKVKYKSMSPCFNLTTGFFQIFAHTSKTISRL